MQVSNIFASDQDRLPMTTPSSLSSVADELECPVCLLEMRPPAVTTIVACANNAHLFCLGCLRRGLKACPVCREDFAAAGQPQRNRLAERWARKIFD